MNTRIKIILPVLLAFSAPVSAQWVHVNADWDALVCSFLDHRGVLFDAEDMSPILWRSTDDGYNWSRADTGLPANGNIQVLGQVDSVLLTGTLNGLMYRSTNNGSSWVPAGSTARVQSFASCGRAAYLGTNAGVWQSTDLGQTWNPVSNGSLSNPDVRGLIACGRILFAGTPSGIFRSSNAGTQWTFLAGSPGLTWTGLWTSAGSTLFVNNGGTWVSTDAGVTWTKNGTETGTCLSLTGNYLFLGGTGSRVRCSSDDGITWADVSANLPTFQWWDYGSPAVSSMVIHDGYVVIGTILTSIYRRPVAEMTEVPLAVQLAGFQCRDGNLVWTTLSEINNYGFYVQYRGSNSAEFADVAGAFIPGNRTTTAAHTYQFPIKGAPGYYRLRQLDLDGSVHFSGEIVIMESQLTGLDEGGGAGVSFSLGQNYPNPFNPTTEIEFSIASAGFASVTVFNVLGQEVAKPFAGEAAQGVHYRIRFDASTLPTGVYVYQLRSGTRVASKRMLLMK